VTLKLVSEGGGEAIANTNWTVLNHDGTTVHESIGAFLHRACGMATIPPAASHDDRSTPRDFP
jgi:hypothetical protein